MSIIPENGGKVYDVEMEAIVIKLLAYQQSFLYKPVNKRCSKSAFNGNKIIY